MPKLKPEPDPYVDHILDLYQRIDLRMNAKHLGGTPEVVALLTLAVLVGRLRDAAMLEAPTVASRY